MEPASQPLRPPAPILRIAIAIQYAIGGAYLPFVTLYFLDHGLDYTQMGWIYLASSAVGATMPFLWGYVADRWVSLEILIPVLHAVATICMLGLAAQDSFHGILVAYTLLSGTYPPTTALLNAVCYQHLDSPERQFGFLRLWGSLGWMLPSLPVFLWHAFVNGIDFHFTLYLAAAFEGTMVVVASRLPHTPPNARKARGSVAGAADATGEPLTYGQSLRRFMHRPGFARLLILIFLMHASFTVLFYYSPPLLEGAGFERKWIGPLQCIGVVVEIPFFFLLPGAIRRFGYRGSIALGCGALLLRQVCYALAAPAWLLATSYVLAGACVVFYLVAVSLALHAMAGRAVRATAQSLLVIVGAGLGQTFGHRVAAFLAAQPGLGLPGVFSFAAIASGAAVVLILTLRKGSPFEHT